MGLFSKAQAERIAVDMYYPSGVRRLQEDVEVSNSLCASFRSIPDLEAKERGLIKKGNAVIRWYEVI